MKLRKEIDEIDKEIIRLLSKRFQYVRTIVEKKQKDEIPIYDPKREKELQEMHKTLAVELGLNPDLILEIFEKIFHETKRQA
jgi:chorismate mutase-like protein